MSHDHCCSKIFYAVLKSLETGQAKQALLKKIAQEEFFPVLESINTLISESTKTRSCSPDHEAILKQFCVRFLSRIPWQVLTYRPYFQPDVYAKNDYQYEFLGVTSALRRYGETLLAKNPMQLVQAFRHLKYSQEILLDLGSLVVTIKTEGLPAQKMRQKALRFGMEQSCNSFAKLHKLVGETKLKVKYTKLSTEIIDKNWAEDVIKYARDLLQETKLFEELEDLEQKRDDTATQIVETICDENLKDSEKQDKLADAIGMYKDTLMGKVSEKTNSNINTTGSRTCGWSGCQLNAHEDKNDAEKSTRFMRCSKCRKAWYCSKDHQKKDWKSHRKICKIFRQ